MTVEDKHSDLSQQLLFHLSDIFHTDFGYFLNRLLAGFVGDKIETKTATIWALSDLVKHQKDEMKKDEKQVSAHFKASEKTLIKIMNIGLQYLKENFWSLHKAILKMCKRVTTALTDEHIVEFA